MRWTVPAAVVAALLLTSCAQAQEFPDEVTLTSGGLERSYRLHVPERVAAGAPLVVVLHGGFGSARQAQDSYGWDELADAEGFVVAYPDGVGRSWNAGGNCCGEAATEAVDDVGFVEAVVDDVRQRVGTGADYAVGMSNGAMMTYRLACDSDVFTAVAVVAGTLLGDCPHPAPVSLLHVHGAADATVRLDGEPGDGRVRIDGLPVEDVVAAFRAADDCPAPVVATVGEVTTEHAACPEGRDVDLVTIAGAGHQWPGAADRPGRERLLGTDPPSTAYDATASAWAFFVAHP